MKVAILSLSLLVGAAELHAGSIVRGKASWYGEEHRGKPMANGRPFDPDELVCASWDYPLGAIVKVTYRSREVILRVEDRGPAKRLVRQGRVVDLSKAAFRRLGADPKIGLIDVEIIRLK